MLSVFYNHVYFHIYLFNPRHVSTDFNNGVYNCWVINFETVPREVIFSCDQAAIWQVQYVRLSVRPSVCLSVCHTFFTMFPSSYHHAIFRSYYQWQKWRPCKRSRSKVKVTEVNTQLNSLRTVTPVWIHIWWWNDAYSLMMLKRGALLFFKVIRQISRWHGSKKRRIWPRVGVSGL